MLQEMPLIVMKRQKKGHLRVGQASGCLSFQAPFQAPGTDYLKLPILNTRARQKAEQRVSAVSELASTASSWPLHYQWLLGWLKAALAQFAHKDM